VTRRLMLSSSTQRAHDAAAARQRPLFLPARRTDFMHKLPMTVQRLILAFTTGLFLACAAHVSAQGDTIPLSSIEP
jgi:hypothetical protein